MFRFLQRNLALSENKGPGGIISRKKPRTCLVRKGAMEIVMSRCNSFLPGQLKATSVIGSLHRINGKSVPTREIFSTNKSVLVSRWFLAERKEKLRCL